MYANHQNTGVVEYISDSEFNSNCSHYIKNKNSKKIFQQNDYVLLEDGWFVGWFIGLFICLFTCKLFNDVVSSKTYISLTGRIVGE